MPAYPRHYEFTSPCHSPATDVPNSVLDSPKYNSSPLDLSFSSYDSSPSPLDLRVAAIDLSVSPTNSPPRYRRTYAFQRYLSRSPSSSSYTESSSTYCSTCVDSSSVQSPRTPSPRNVNTASKYCPLSPLSRSSVIRKRFYDEQDNLCLSPVDNIPSPYFSSECLSSPPRNLYRQMSPNYSSEYKSTMLDYSPLSPETTYPVYCDSSPDYSFSTIPEERSKSPTLVDSPISSSSYYGFSSPSDYSPPTYKYTLDTLSKSTTSSQNINYRRPSRYTELSASRRYRSTSPTYYPLSPQDTPSTTPQYYHLSPLRVKRRDIEDDDIPCVCCSPPPSQY